MFPITKSKPPTPFRAIIVTTTCLTFKKIILQVIKSHNIERVTTREKNIITRLFTSILGKVTPNLEDRCPLAKSSFGDNSLAAGPPSTPKSLNL